MKRFLVTATFAAVGLTLFAVNQTQAAGHSGSQGRHGEMRGHGHEHGGHHFRANERFGYGRYGYRSFSYTRSYWSNYYRCYCYWAPSYGWCFYEPTYSYYVPVSRYYEVYPEAKQTIAPPVASSPAIIQQTTVVTAPSTPSVVPPPVPEVAPAPTVEPAPTAVQKTKVGQP